MPFDTTTLPIDPAVIGLGAALAVGLVIGLERGWREREQAEGSRVAGLRTFALIGLFGGVTAQLRGPFGAWPLATGLLGLALVTMVTYSAWVRSSGRLSATTTVAALLTFALGALAASGSPALAAGVAVVVAVLLDLKSTLHRWLRRIEQRELSAALQMLVLSVVVLPLLPDRGYGPYEALNPYRLWWAVVLVSGLSLGGHVAMRASGPQRGLLWTGLLGGLASSTAATLTLARQARQDPSLRSAATAGILGACGVMFLRMTLIAVSLQPALGRALAAPLLAAGAALLALALLQWRRLGGLWHSTSPHDEPPAAGDENEPQPFDLSVALGFAAFLGVMAVLGRAAHELFGTGGLYGLALASGLADVDAILITLARMQASGNLAIGAAVAATLLAAASNQVSKAGIAWVSGGAALGQRVAVGYALATLAAALGAGLATLAGWLG